MITLHPSFLKLRAISKAMGALAPEIKILEYLDLISMKIGVIKRVNQKFMYLRHEG